MGDARIDKFRILVTQTSVFRGFEKYTKYICVYCFVLFEISLTKNFLSTFTKKKEKGTFQQAE
jgi:hypothetical protein